MKIPFKKTRVQEVKKEGELARERFKPFLNFIKGKKVYLALSGGGLPLVCHIAILRFFENFNIQVEKIYGASAGAVIGGFYAAGLNASQLKEAALCLKNPDEVFGKGSRHLVYRAVRSELHAHFNKGGFKNSAIYDGRRLERYIEKSFIELFGYVPLFKDLKSDFTAVAFNIGTGKSLDAGSSAKKLFSTAETPYVSLKDAIIASISIPGIFPPIKIDDHYYIDGGIAEHLPIISAYEDWLKVRKFYEKNLVIVAVDLGYLGETMREKSIIRPYDMVMYSFNVRGKEITHYSLLRTHQPKKGSHVVLLKPRCYDMGITDFEKIPGAIEKSYENILNQLEGDNFLKETQEDIKKARIMLGVNERF